MIPEAAVEAAAWVLDPQTMGSGGVLSEKFKAATRSEARRILEAAAPHMWSTWAAKDCDGSSCCASPEHIEGCFSTNPDYRNQE